MKKIIKCLLVATFFTTNLFYVSSTVAKTDNDDVDITLIVHCCLGHPFWEPLLKGARDAAEQLGVNVDFQNAEFDPAAQVNMIEQAVANKQDAIIPMIAHPDAQTEPLIKAQAQGIVVVAANTDHPDGAASGSRESYVGPNFVDSGIVIANYIAEQGGLKEGDHCVLPGVSPEQWHIAARGEGVLKGLKAHGITGEIIRSGEKEEGAIDIISQYLIANPDTDCAIGLGGTATSVMPQAIDEAGLDLIPNGGFDTMTTISTNIREGKTLATVDQQPYWQGYLGVIFATMKVRYGLGAPDFNSSTGLITKDNLGVVEKYAGTYR